MYIIQEPQISVADACQYLSDEIVRFEYFFATGLDIYELDELLSRGWRKFGLYYFRPLCPGCRKCVPLRIRAKKLIITKNLRRVIRKADGIRVIFRPLRFRQEIFEIYRDHSLNRFGKDASLENFINTFYIETCPALQSEYYLGEELIAAGFLDRSNNALSSVYFIYKTVYENYSLGTYSVLKETEYAASLGLDFYYLGYYIAENRKMAYKNRFRENEKYNWLREVWEGEPGEK